jgi:hypothetical protein
MSLSEKVVTTFQTANAPSTPAAVRIALGDDRQDRRRSKLVVVLVDELGRVEGMLCVHLQQVEASHSPRSTSRIFLSLANSSS